MSLIEEDSHECSTSPLEWFQVSPTQTAIERSFETEYQPLTPIADGQAVEFSVPASVTEYIDLQNTKLYVKFKLTNAAGGDLVAEDVVAPINDIFNSMWSNVELKLNGRLISQSSNTHGYTSIISHLIHDSDESLNSERAMRLIYKDSANQMDVTEARLANNQHLIPGFDIISHAPVGEDGVITYTDLAANAVVGNNGLHYRYLQTRLSKPVEMLGRLRIDMFEQERYLPNGIEMKIRLHPQTDAYRLMTAGNYKLKLIDAHLAVRRVEVSPGVISGHMQNMLMMPAKFPIIRKECKTIAIAAGMRDVKRDNIFHGQLPKRVVIGMVDGDAFAGVSVKNPYNFKHFNIKHMQLFSDGTPIRTDALTPNIATGSYLNCYESLYRGLNNMDGDKGSIIKRVDWDKGYSLFAYDLTPDMDEDDHYALIRHGNLRLDIQFNEALLAPISIIIYAEFDNIIEITGEKNIIIDFN